MKNRHRKEDELAEEQQRRMSANITPGHVRAFQMVTSSLYNDRMTLWSCTIDGEPGVAIVMFDQVTDDKLAVMPLFVAITPKMQIEFEGTAQQDGGGEGGGPRVARAFRAARLALDLGD
jgi:hypothetical protein